MTGYDFRGMEQGMSTAPHRSAERRALLGTLRARLSGACGVCIEGGPRRKTVCWPVNSSTCTAASEITRSRLQRGLALS